MNKLLLLTLSLITFGLIGCDSFYSCAFKLERAKCTPENISILQEGMGEISEQFGLQLYIKDERSTIYRKGPNAALPARYKHLESSTKMQITLVYHPETCRVIISQRDKVDEIPYTREIREAVTSLLNEIFGDGGYQIDIGTWSKSPLA